jgi:NTE family protein
LSVLDQIGPVKTAFVFAGGGSFGAIQVGMLHSLAAHGIAADMVVGSSVGALNGAFYAGDPTLGGVERLATVWRGRTYFRSTGRPCATCNEMRPHSH